MRVYQGVNSRLVNWTSGRFVPEFPDNVSPGLNGRTGPYTGYGSFMTNLDEFRAFPLVLQFRY